MRDFDGSAPFVWVLFSFAFALLVGICLSAAVVTGVGWAFRLPGRVVDYVRGAE